MSEERSQRRNGTTSGRWKRARAAIITYFVVFNVLAALPSVGTASAERLERPFEGAELRRWASLFQAVGIDVDPTELGQSYLAFAGVVERARAMALSPIEWWMSLFQVGQSWRLFSMPDASASALRLSAHSRDPCATLTSSSVSCSTSRWR